MSIQDLLNSNGQLLSFQEFNKYMYDCDTTFLRFYQVTSAIPKYLVPVIQARNTGSLKNKLYARNNFLFQIHHFNIQNTVDNAKTRDFCGLLNQKIHTVRQTGPMNWNTVIKLDENAWKKKFHLPK